MVLCKQVVFFGIILSLSTCHIDGKIIPQAEQNLVEMEGCVVNRVKHNARESLEGSVCIVEGSVEDGVLNGKKCAEPIMGRGCKMSDYLTAPYPDCCPKVTCPE